MCRCCRTLGCVLYWPCLTIVPLLCAALTCVTQLHTAFVATQRPEFERVAMSRRVRPLGLLNLGQTCYLNATLQALLHLRQFTSLMHSLDQGDQQLSTSVKPTPLLDAVKSLIGDL